MSITQSTEEISPFDIASNTSFLGKSHRDTFIFTGVASNVSSINLGISALIN